MTGRTLEESYEGFTLLLASAVVEWYSRMGGSRARHRRRAA